MLPSTLEVGARIGIVRHVHCRHVGRHSSSVGQRLVSRLIEPTHWNDDVRRAGLGKPGLGVIDRKRVLDRPVMVMNAPHQRDEDRDQHEHHPGAQAKLRAAHDGSDYACRRGAHAVYRGSPDPASLLLPQSPPMADHP